MLIHPDNKEVIRGRHRGVTRRHRSAHRGDYASILARMVPAWTLSPGRGDADRPDRGPRSGAGTPQGRIPVLGNDLRPSTRLQGEAIEIDLRTSNVAVVDHEPFDVAQLEDGLLSAAPDTDSSSALASDHAAGGDGPVTAAPGTEWRFEDILHRLRNNRISNKVTTDSTQQGRSLEVPSGPPMTGSESIVATAGLSGASLAGPLTPDTSTPETRPHAPTVATSPAMDSAPADVHVGGAGLREETGHIETDGGETDSRASSTQAAPSSRAGTAGSQATTDALESATERRATSTYDSERPIWDPTGRHSGASTLPHPSERRRFSFADMLGFGDDTETFAIDDIGADTSEADHGWADFPTLASVAVDDAPTNQLVERLWHATAEHPITSPADQLAPVDVQQLFRSNRTFRWSVLATAVIVLIVVLVTLRAVGQRPVTVAQERATEYAQGIDAVASSLLGFESTARTIANPATETSALGELTADLLLVGGAARSLAESAGEALPEPSLLGPSAAIDRLQSPQELLRQAAEATLTVERRLGDAVSYRVLIEQAFATSELPVAARESELGDIGAQLSVVQATTERALAQLPEDAFFASHTDAAAALLTSFETWQVQYLDALRQGDVAAAGVLRRDWRNAHAAFMADIATPLMAIDEWSSDEIEHVRGLLTVAAERLGDGAFDDE